MHRPVAWLPLLVPLVCGFRAPLPQHVGPTKRAVTTLRNAASEPSFTSESENYHKIVEELKEDYRLLQMALFDQCQTPGSSELKASEHMIRDAADKRAEECRQQSRKLIESGNHLDQVNEDVQAAEELVTQAHQDAIAADNRAFVVASMDEVFDTKTHEHNVQDAEAAHHVEEDAKELLTDVQFEELVAEIEYEQAESLWRDLEANAKLLHESLEYIREEERLQRQWEAEHLPKHKSFLETARKSMSSGKMVSRSGKLIDHDPSKGNVAF